jgi:hypothetical protein
LRCVFVSLHFDADCREILNALEAVGRGYNIEILHGADLESGGWTADLVSQRVNKADGLIAFVTRRENGKTHDWLTAEFQMARGNAKTTKFQIVVEESEQLPGPLQGQPAIPFDRQRPLPAFADLFHRIKTWAGEWGRATWARLEHSEVDGVLAQHPHAKCRYRFMRSATNEEIDWRYSEIKKIHPDVRVHIEWPEDYDLIMLQLTDVTDDRESVIWETNWQYRLVSIRREH